MRILFSILLACLAPFASLACTSFKVTTAGLTLIGCNEDAWSTNAQVRFEQGHDGRYGGIYLGHFNGSPLRAMTDQMGMNEAGLVFDGLRIPTKQTPAKPGLPALAFDGLMTLVLRSCADVHQAAAVLRTYDRNAFAHAMIFLADRDGGYLIVENDTLIEGHDPWYAVGNWRMGSCSDPDAIPIPRLQAGRALLAGGAEASAESATRVLESMRACRTKLGNGTLFSALFDPTLGQTHLFFYHDFRERITFDLKQELAKGDRTVDMASLFGEKPEFEALKCYITPFHQRWLFWAMTTWLVLTVLVGMGCGIWFLRDLLRLFRHRAHGSLPLPLFLGLASVVLVALLAALLLNEAPYYFGLGDVDPALAWLPVLFLAFTVGFLYLRPSRVWRYLAGVQLAAVLVMCIYWDMLWP